MNTLFNNPIKVSTYSMAKTEIDDPMCACNICRKQFREYNSLHKTPIAKPIDLDCNKFLHTSRAIEKSTHRINEILKHIENMKTGSHKKYQVRGYHEYKQISKHLNEYGIRHELELSNTQYTKKLSELEVYVNTRYIQQNYAIYKSDNVKCMYVKVWK